MRQEVVAASLLAATLFVWEMRPAAQNTRAEKSHDQSGQGLAKPGIAGGATGSQCQPMMDVIEQMRTYEQEMALTMNKLMQNVTDLQNEKEAATLRPKLAEQRGMLEVMNIYVTQQSNITQSLAEQVRQHCSAPANAEKPAPH